jgi:hypothetical protein
MSLAPGDKLGPYEILAPLGAGGMGEVYKARDTRLDRLIAIKTSRTEFSERFAREARAVAALNHPNICQLYDLGTMPEGGSYLVMEFIDGSPVGPVDSQRRLLDLAVQISDGMAAAHAAGFTHRDLKPDNVLITGPQTPHPGRVKILDFGLAKSAASLPQSEATRTIAAVTNPGTVMGTEAYMSPEQARGEEVDSRSDQFSFGLIVYELAARKRAFARPSAAETMAAIIRDDADPLAPSVSAPLRWVVERCLAKDPAERYESTKDLYRELKHAREHLSEGSVSGQQAAQPAKSRPRWHGRVTFAALAAACAAGAFLFLRSPHSDPPSFQSLTFRREIISNARFTADGKTVVYDSTEAGAKYHIYPFSRATRSDAIWASMRNSWMSPARAKWLCSMPRENCRVRRRAGARHAQSPRAFPWRHGRPTTKNSRQSARSMAATDWSTRPERCSTNLPATSAISGFRATAKRCTWRITPCGVTVPASCG